MHRNLLEGLERSQEMKLDPSRAVADVTQHFLTQHTGFLHYGQYAVRLPFASERVRSLSLSLSTTTHPLSHDCLSLIG